MLCEIACVPILTWWRAGWQGLGRAGRRRRGRRAAGWQQPLQPQHMCMYIQAWTHHSPPAPDLFVTDSGLAPLAENSIARPRLARQGWWLRGWKRGRSSCGPVKECRAGDQLCGGCSAQLTSRAAGCSLLTSRTGSKRKR